jgi:hypothetical protein
MKKIKIGFMNYEATQNKTKTHQKEVIYKKAYALCHLYVTIENEEEFKDSFSRYSIDLCTKNLGLKNPNIEKIIQLTNIPVHTIKKLEMDYKRIIVDAPETDYNIYATTDTQIEEYNKLKKVCDSLNELNVYTLKICQAFGDRLTECNGILCPNWHYIKSL